MTVIHHPMINVQDMVTSACPEQWKGLLTDGQWFYFRMRFGRASLALGVFYEQTMGRMDHEVDVCNEFDPMRGYFESDQERDETFARLLDRALSSEVD